MTPTLTAFKNSPDKGKGQARDMRVRWMLEEVGQPYNVRLRTIDELKQPAHRAIQPFGQIPAYEEGHLVLFESGAIILHLAEQHGRLLPKDSDERKRAVMWLIAALNTVEPPIRVREEVMVLEQNEPWYEKRLPRLDEAVRQRLGDLSNYLGERAWLENEFTIGDLMMMMVLFRLADGPLLNEYPNLAAYLARGMARPGFKKALDKQRADYEA